ncbi:MAG TPA: DASS family sodium-coupled anion symporter [Candidatus Polarisedimenticolaceae bacterium]|nr:DASS family sodium-coupled anion symporter [Candidatus Polarisedimenticolaceae bacterium]
MPAAVPPDASRPHPDQLRQTAGFVLAPLAFVAVWLAPVGLDPVAHRLAAVFALVVVLWISEAIPLAATALVGPALCVPLGIASAKDAFAEFGNPIIFLFLGSFVIAAAMRTHGLDRRIALFVLSRRWVGESPTRILFAFGAIAALLSMWMSNTATTAMMLPIGCGVLATLAPQAGSPRASYGTGLMLMIAYASSIGGIATPVGTPPNLIALGLIEELGGRRYSFLEWMSFGVPVSVVLFAATFVLIRRLFRPPAVRLAGAASTIRRERAALGAMSAGERAVLTSFLLAVSLWTLPGLVTLAFGAAHPATLRIESLLPNEGPSAILAASVLFVLPVDWRARRFALSWQEAARVDWGTILLFGGGLSLGSLAFSTGLAGALGDRFLAATGDLPVLLLSLCGLFLANVMTEFMSNTATANLLVPMFLALAGVTTGDALLATVAVTIGCSLAFCFPVATPPNAIVYGSGLVPLTQMIRAGVWLDLGCGLLAWVVLAALIGG